MSLLKRNIKLQKYAERVQSQGVSTSANIAQEIYRKNVELAHTNQTLSLLRSIDVLVLETENSLTDLVQGIAKALVDNSNYLFGAIFMRHSSDDDMPMSLGGFGSVSDGSTKGKFHETLNMIELHTDLVWFKSKEYSLIVDLDSPDETFLKSVFKSGADKLLSVATDLKCSSLCLVKLPARNNLVGILIVGVATDAKSLSLSDLEYLGRIGEAAGIAIDNKLLFEENQNILKRLKRSNDKLKALDEAKDEFISMASHQLRTPLTSVKGYMSMVIEEDAGKLNVKQKALLDQAFLSSQRMVYLIADLLNVSRLRTGKFVIERQPTKLDEVISGEIMQLRETAKSRNLKLIYEKPKNFPALMLDETKTRQVIMNFADNAVYYTPNNGTIEIKLLDKSSTIEFLVIDNGIGVPKADHHHLFTKFYRAGNARKARPDGTGLGLFMAKKVIVAQGGAIIFKSQEGKGSTFGFSFPKAGILADTKSAKKS